MQGLEMSRNCKCDLYGLALDQLLGWLGGERLCVDLGSKSSLITVDLLLHSNSDQKGSKVNASWNRAILTAPRGFSHV